MSADARNSTMPATIRMIMCLFVLLAGIIRAPYAFIELCISPRMDRARPVSLIIKSAFQYVVFFSANNALL